MSKILLAIGCKNHGVVIATDDYAVEMDCDGISDMIDDLGIITKEDWKNGAGVYLWEGAVTFEKYIGFYGECEGETKYKGVMRPVEPHELVELSAMRPKESDITHWVEGGGA